MATRSIPDTRRGQILRRILTVVLIGAIVGVADQLRALFWIRLLGWSGYKGYRHNLAPPTWVVILVPVLTSIYLVLPS